METFVYEGRGEPGLIDVIYLSGGQGKRAKLGYPKQFARIGGKPIMIHGLEILQQIEEINNVILVYPNGMSKGEVKALISPYFDSNFIGRVRPTPGGLTRQESVFNGLKWVTTSYVLIAEAVRPFITVDFVKDVINTDADFVVPVSVSVSSVLSYVDGIINYIPRDFVGEVQTPQKFETKMLRRAHVEVPTNDYSDDSVLVLKMTKGISTVLVDGLEQNIKITTPLDLVIAEAIYNDQYDNKE